MITLCAEHKDGIYLKKMGDVFSGFKLFSSIQQAYWGYTRETYISFGDGSWGGGSDLQRMFAINSMQYHREHLPREEAGSAACLVWTLVWVEA